MAKRHIKNLIKRTDSLIKRNTKDSPIFLLYPGGCYVESFSNPGLRNASVVEFKPNFVYYCGNENCLKTALPHKNNSHILCSHKLIVIFITNVDIPSALKKIQNSLINKNTEI